MTWMARLNRVFAIDIETCPRCGGKLRVIGAITDPNVIARIVRHVEQREHHHPRFDIDESVLPLDAALLAASAVALLERDER